MVPKTKKIKLDPLIADEDDTNVEMWVYDYPLIPLSESDNFL